MSQAHSRPTRTSGEKNTAPFLLPCTKTQVDILNDLAGQFGVSRACLIRQLVSIGLRHLHPNNTTTEEEFLLRNWGGQKLESDSGQNRWNAILNLVERWPGA